MMPDALRDTMEMARRIGGVTVATATDDGTPHLATAGALRDAGDGRVAVEEWFCPGTLANLEANRRIAIAVYDSQADRGHQIVGTVERVEDVEILDGRPVGDEESAPVPQVERRLIVRPEHVYEFRRTPHSDREE